MPQRGGRYSGSNRQQAQPRVAYPLPKDTNILVKSYVERCLNYGLRIERLLLCKEGTWDLTQQAKKRLGIRAFQHPELVALLDAYRHRWEALLAELRGHGWAVKPFPMYADSRVVVGLGSESVLETNIRLHRIYGFPIIPGSALKGLARAYAKLVAHVKEEERVFQEVFGTASPEARAGKVIFLDAIPANPKKLKLELDVMNPHYSEYYRGGDVPPADYLNPTPIYFLTIGPGSEFLFAVTSESPELASKAEAWLRGGLKELGVGAKTTAGYGYWTA